MRKLVLSVLLASSLFAQSAPPVLQSEAVFPRRFLAAHGERAIVEGYSSSGLESWIYPYQIFRGYRLAVRRAADSSAVDSLLLLRRVEVTPSTVSRIYTGPDFVLREELFVPRERAGLLITYTVDSPEPVDVLLRLTPVMDLMWPAAAGGQSASWSEANAGYLLRSGDGALALISSPQMTAHDVLWNSTQNSLAGEIGMTLRVSGAQPTVLAVAAGTSAAAKEEELARDVRVLWADSAQLHEESAAHYAKLIERSLQIETPEPAVNTALQWAAIALEQSWVCEDDLGCAYVAGYGPSRSARRPQYQWFFAGDGMISASAAVELGDFAHARQELDFILKYQDAESGMMWHELTLSAGRFDWKNKFPYMFVHVDLAFQFLSAVQNYVEKSGDKAFAREHWPQIEAAYRYCRSTLDAATGLPRIPASKSGANEQDKLSDELSLSAAWVEAARAYSALASYVNDQEASRQARMDAESASPQIVPRYWNAAANSFFSAHTQDGHPVTSHSLAELSLLEPSLPLPAQQRRAVLDRLSGSDFQTDWGSRGMAPGEGYAPATYSKGSVWPISTAEMANTLWSNQRPWSAEAVWRTLFAGTAIDSLGHLPEVYNGAFFQTQEEGVPEQTWSSAALLHATVDGLLGLHPKTSGAQDMLTFAPNLPAQWDFVRVRNVRLGGRNIALELRRDSQGLVLNAENSGEPFVLDFRPLLPLGARLGKAHERGGAQFTLLPTSPEECETRAVAEVRIPHGTAQLQVSFVGGTSLIVPPPEIAIGERSRSYKLRSACIEGERIHFRLDARGDHPTLLRLRAAGASGEVVREVNVLAGTKANDEYRPVEAWFDLGGQEREIPAKSKPPASH